MEQKPTKLCPSAPLMSSEQDLGQRLEGKISDIKSFYNSTKNIKEMITYVKVTNYKPKKEI